MENFFFALNATVPVFLVILAGYFLQRVGLLNDGFNRTANQYVFQCALPVSLFRSIAGMDFYSEFDPRFCLFCFAATTGMFLGVWGASALLLRDKSHFLLSGGGLSGLSVLSAASRSRVDPSASDDYVTCLCVASGDNAAWIIMKHYPL